LEGDGQKQSDWEQEKRHKQEKCKSVSYRAYKGWIIQQFSVIAQSSKTRRTKSAFPILKGKLDRLYRRQDKKTNNQNQAWQQKGNDQFLPSVHNILQTALYSTCPCLHDDQGRGIPEPLS
jgi:hypothetical protein